MAENIKRQYVTHAKELNVRCLNIGKLTDLPEFSLEYNEPAIPDRSDCFAWRLNGEKIHCVQIMFIGKTGYGKSTTLNKLCGHEYFMADDIRSCTKTLFSVEYEMNNKGVYLSLCDLPGLGESIESDKKYFEMYEKMLEVSHCVVYLLRADQRDFTIDEVAFNELLKYECRMKSNLIVAINFADKVEPLSLGMPFKPNDKQLQNLEIKVQEVMKVFDLPRERIVFYSATDGFNLEVLRNSISEILTRPENIFLDPEYMMQINGVKIPSLMPPSLKALFKEMESFYK